MHPLDACHDVPAMMMSLGTTFALSLWAAAVAEAALETPEYCSFSIVGAGWAGIYTAWRLTVDSKHFDGQGVCLFEAAERLGGKTFTISDDGPPLKGLRLDVGAYRFAFEQHLPADLIRGPLNLTTSCYMPSCSREPLDGNLTLHKLVDPRTGESLGFGSALEAMVEQLQLAGVRIFTKHRLDDIFEFDTNGAKLIWAGREISTRADNVLLNLPRHAIMALGGNSVIHRASSSSTSALLSCSDEVGGSKEKEATVKVYLVYEDAWWITKLGLREGEPKFLETDPPLAIRYHDGPIQCGGGSCRGALMVLYSFSLGMGSQWYMQFQSSPHQKVGIFEEGPLLDAVHAKLMQVHADSFASLGIDPQDIPRPSAAVVGWWNHAREVILHPAPDPITTQQGTLPSCAWNMSTADYVRQVVQPVLGRNIFIANNDWWLQDLDVDVMPPYWAEVSLRTAERILGQYFSINRPGWLDSEYYLRKVLLQESTAIVV